MTFNSFSYALFLPLVYLAFSFAPDRLRWLVLLISSYVFYASFKAPQLLVALALVTALSYGCGILIGRAPDEGRRGRIFWSGTAACLFVMAYMKYLPPLLCFAGPDARSAGLFNAIGVSFFVFQAISYLADIYLGIQEPERHPGYHALSLAFFPKLLQGPIERAGDLLPQLKKAYRFDYDTLRSGLVLFAWGLFKKVVIADRLSGLVNMVYDNVSASTPLSALVATYFYAIQLYCDFSGYTDMALGTALLFNIRLSPNFNNPYLATSIADFWRRWHLSFSSWILDYIFRPLQMQWRYGRKFGTACALMVTFLVSGLWHGARWGFIAWGALHGAYLATSVYADPLLKKMRKRFNLDQSRAYSCFRIFITFHLVCFAWIFFRSNSISDAFGIIHKIGRFSFSILSIEYLRNTIGGLGMTQADMSIICICFVFTAVISILDLRSKSFEKLFKCRLWMRWAFYVTLLLFVILLAQMQYVPYLYFKF
jgi:alginate O-acetyltransferase complex protein AlgI